MEPLEDRDLVFWVEIVISERTRSLAQYHGVEGWREQITMRVSDYSPDEYRALFSNDCKRFGTSSVTVDFDPEPWPPCAKGAYLVQLNHAREALAAGPGLVWTVDQATGQIHGVSNSAHWLFGNGVDLKFQHRPLHLMPFKAQAPESVIAESESIKAAIAAGKAETEKFYADRKEKNDAEIQAWIDQHGSERLKKGALAGYSVCRLYRDERASYLLGEIYVSYPDHDGSGGTERKTSPSLIALEMADDINDAYIDAWVSIVWTLAFWADDDDDTEPYVEAILVRDLFPRCVDIYIPIN